MATKPARTPRIAGRLAALAIAGVVIVALSWFQHLLESGSAMRYAVAIVQGTVFTAAIAFVYRPPRGSDELWQRVFRDAMSFAFIGALGLAMTYSLLRQEGLGEIAPFWYYLALITLWFIGYGVGWLRYR